MTTYTVTTMAEVLDTIGAESQDDWGSYLERHDPEPDAVTFRASELISPSASADFYRGAWANITTREVPDREREIETYSPTTGVITWPSRPLLGGSPAGTPAPLQLGEQVQVWTRWRPRDVEAAVRRAQGLMWTRTRQTLTGASIDGLRQIALTPTCPDLKSAGQLLRVAEQIGAEPGALRDYVPGLDYTAYAPAAGQGLLLQLGLAGPTYTAQQTLVIEYWASWATRDPIPPGALVQTETGTPRDWLAWEAILLLAQSRAYRDPDLEKRAQGELIGWRAQYESPQSYRGFQPAEPWAAGLGVPQ